MKSIFAVSFFVTLLFPAGTAFSYQCDIPAPPPQVQPCSLGQQKQCKEPQCRQHYRSGKKCNCNKRARCTTQKKPCREKIVRKDSYQCKTCKTTCSTTTEQINMVQCRLCGTRYPKGVDHYCNKVPCKSCGQIYPRGVEHRCGMKQCRTCGTQYKKKKQHDCGEIRCQSCGVSYHPRFEHHCRTRQQQNNDCSQGKQCSTQQGCSITHKEARETRWHKWFKNQS